MTAVRVFHPRGTAGAWREGALRGRDVGGGRDGQRSGERPAKRQRTEGDGARIDPKYKFVRFTLFKENRDTMGGISELSRYTSLAPKKFSYAGTKDRRACTAQHVTVNRADSRYLLQVNRKIHFGLVLGNFVYCQVRVGKKDLIYLSCQVHTGKRDLIHCIFKRYLIYLSIVRKPCGLVTFTEIVSSWCYAT